MTLHELLALADEAEARQLQRFYAVVPRPCSGYLRMKVAPGLYGEVCTETADRRTVVLIAVADARAWLRRRGLPMARLVGFGLSRPELQAAMDVASAVGSGEARQL